MHLPYINGTSKRQHLATVNEVLTSWSTEIIANGGTMSHAQAVHREQEVVRKVNQGAWSMDAYHEYQMLAAGTGNVDSSRLLLEYALLPSMQRYLKDKDSGIFHLVATCNIDKLNKYLEGNVVNMDIEDDTYGTTALMVACYFGCTESVRILLKEGADPNLSASHGMNSLMIAAVRGEASLLPLLVHEGKADVNARHKFAATTALHMTAELGLRASISALCNLNSDITLTTLTGANALHVAAQVNAFSSVKPLIQNCKIAPDALMNNDTTALYLASQHGHLKFTEALLNHGANVSYRMPVVTYQGKTDLAASKGSDMSLVLNSEPANGAEAIHAAAENGHLEVVQMLLKFGANIDSVTIGISPVHLAVQYNRVSVVKYLIDKGADLEKRSTLDGTTPLHYAVKENNIDIIKLLVDANASCSAVDNFGYFPLFIAAATGHVTAVKEMVRKEKCNVNFVSLNKISALHVASSGGHVESVIELLNAGADYHLLAGESGDTALQLAARNCHDMVVKRTLKFIKSMSIAMGLKDTLNTNNYFGYNALHDVIQTRSGVSSKENSQACFSVAMLLLSAGVDVNSAVSSGSAMGATAIYIAAINDDVQMLELLMSHKGDPNINLDPSVGGYTPLVAAIDRGYANVAKVLLRGFSEAEVLLADPNHGGVSNSWSQSPLLFAVVRGRADIAQILLNAGADCTVQVAMVSKNKKESTPTSESLLDIARNKRLYDVLQVLSTHESCQIISH